MTRAEKEKLSTLSREEKQKALRKMIREKQK